MLTWFQAVSHLKDQFQEKIILVGEVKYVAMLSHILNSKAGAYHTTYLGLPVGASNKDQTTWNPVLQRIEKKLVG